ncbi:MAG: hypothetical protein ABIP35_00435 [Ginsengibacter sp.]
MKYLTIFFLFFLIFTGNFLTLSAQQTNITKDGSHKTYAVIIGITNYQNPAIPALQYADKDAQQFAGWLQSKAGGLVPQNNIKLLVNKEATIAAVYDALDWLKEQCKENDEAYIYFSGHGDVETKNNYSKGYLLTYNSPQNNYANNAIRIEDINNQSILLTTKNKAKVIIISDACHSGKLAGDFYKGKQLVAGQLNQILNNQVRLASCREDELAAEGPDWGGGRGIFSYYLIMGLQGLADIQKDSSIHLSDLSKYLDSAFAADKFLAQNKHVQNPVSDGNPSFIMAKTDGVTMAAVKESINKNKSAGSSLPVGLLALKPLQRQPIDYFFTTASSIAIESILNFDDYVRLDAAALPSRMISDCIAHQKKLYAQRDTSQNTEIPYDSYEVFNQDSLGMLAKELEQNKSMSNRFVSKFIQMVHQKGQDMINAYLKGDLDELEKRQYYYSGDRDYKNYISMLHVAMKLVSPDHQLARILQVHNYYLSGLIDRLQMATHTNTDSLLKLAFYNEQQALKLEPYAAYISNELGNLYLHKKNYDSANYHFNLASVISPAWAIPWSNKIRMNLAFGKMDKAEQDIQTADSLQPDLAYVLINAGLVMEKKKNLLAAESFYLRAIKENNVHYLPYERLANIYLNTGLYDKANFYFHETETRKEDFAINDKDFEYGVELGGIGWNEMENEILGCPGDLPVNSNSSLYTKLYKSIKNDSIKNDENLVKSLQEILDQKPDMPLANHYLGKKQYQKGNWQLAQQSLEKAILNYLSDDELMKKITKDIFDKNPSDADSCMLKPFLNIQFDALEDRYMLADIYEKKGDNDKAFAQYNLITADENKRLQKQAGYKNYAELVKNFPGMNYELDNYLTKMTESPLIMTGSIKSARLHEKLGQYAAAEKVLLQQVSLSRAAGDSRQKAIDEKKPGWNVNGAGGINFYWLAANSYLESETYNFYVHMLTLSPRDSEWQRKAGLFLYRRLSLAFEQMPVKQYQSFYKSISEYAYPWKGAVEQNEDYHFMIPGTGDSVMIRAVTYDPVKEALDALILSVKFSGDIKPDIETAKSLANIYSWMGNTDQSIEWFQQSLSLNPTDVKQRNKFADYLTAGGKLPEAYNQLKILYGQKKITQKQIIQLADWQFLSGKNTEAATLLQKIKPIDGDEKRQLLLLKARTNSLQGKAKIALNYLKDSLSLHKINDTDGYEINEAKEFQNRTQLYSIARLYSILKKDELAFATLKKTLDAGFNYEYVLDYDKVWDPIRKTRKWDNLLNNYTFELETLQNDFNPIGYRIPRMKTAR